MDKITRTIPLDSEEEVFEKNIRPKTLEDFIGQPRVVENLKVFIKAARERGEPLEHVLFHGPPGLGKTTLAVIIANEMGSSISMVSGPSLSRPADLVGILTNIEERGVLFIDEIHRTPRIVEEYLYTAMEDFRIDVVLDSGPGARTMSIKLNRFTLVGATTRIGLLTEPLRHRFGFTFRLSYYSIEELCKIIERTSRILGVNITYDGVEEIAKRSRGTPRVSNRLLKRIRDYAQVEQKDEIDHDFVLYVLQKLGVDSKGLDEMDRKILRILYEVFKGGPAGLRAIAQSVGEDEGTLETVYEPFLVQIGFIKRTKKGRQLTDKAIKYLFGVSQEKLF